MGVVLWYQIEFPDLKMKVSSDVYSGSYLVDAAISISYAIGQPGTFEVNFNDLPLAVTRALADQLGRGTGVNGGVKININLGYLDDPGSHQTVLAGRVETITASTSFRPLGTKLTGHEEASFLLLNSRGLDDGKPGSPLAVLSWPKSTSGSPVRQADVATHILDTVNEQLGAAGYVAEAGPFTPADPLAGAVNDSARDAFTLLDRLAARFGAEILVQDGQLLFGQALQFPPDDTTVPAIPNPAAILALVTGDDSLICVRNMETARLAEFTPVQIGSTSRRPVETDVLPPQADVKAFDFTALGLPSLRAGQLVAASVDGYQNPFNSFRILSVTHAFSTQVSMQPGYTCTGRAVVFQPDQGNRRRSDDARGGNAQSVADRIAGKIREGQASSPAVDVGQVKSADAAGRAATVFYGQQASPGVSAPSVGLDVPAGEQVLLGKPVAAPFAWHNTGLCVPVYPGMRALLNGVRGSRDDSVVTGFLWADQPQMNRPRAKDGDWWLCLPTALSEGASPQPTGAGANDLTAADGRRVIEVAGLSVTVGKDKSTPVGERPAEGPADVFLITHKSGTTIQIDADGNVQVNGQGSQVVLSCGGATLTVGNGKVAIS
jgi:hypothetical protein